MTIKMRRTIRILLYTLSTLIAMAVLAETILQAAALFTSDRAGERETDKKRVILCVGDSHTYGLMVEAEASYPQRLQTMLDQRAPGQYRVINLGIPATNTGQALDRLRLGLNRYQPEMVIIWCGVNNAWNRADPTNQTGNWLSRVHASIERNSRLYRFFKVWRHDRKLERKLAETDPERQRYAVSFSQNKAKVVMDDRSEELDLTNTGFRVETEMEERALRDYREMVRESRTFGAWVVMLAYPIEKGPFAAANRAMRRIFDTEGVLVIETWKSVERLPQEKREFLWAGHPNAAAYAEIAKDVSKVVLAGKPSKEIQKSRKGQLARLNFEVELPSNAESKSVSPMVVKGTCKGSGADCFAGKGCYRWYPNGSVCYLQQQLTVSARALELSARLRVASYPSADNGSEILAVIEGMYGTGLIVELIDQGQLRLHARGSQRVERFCGPMQTRLDQNIWYGIQLKAQKSDQAEVRLKLVDSANQLLDSISCAEQPTGGGAFSHLRVGSANPTITSGEVVFDEVVATILTKGFER